MHEGPVDLRENPQSNSSADSIILALQNKKDNHISARCRKARWTFLGSRKTKVLRVKASHAYKTKKTSGWMSFCFISARRDSNPRPRPWQGRAPPTEPLAHVFCCLAATMDILHDAAPFVNNLGKFFSIILMWHNYPFSLFIP